jgi:hypothetical protein
MSPHPNHEHRRRNYFILWSFLSNSRIMAIPRSEIHEIEVHLDFHIYAILEFDILIGYPLEKLFQQKPFLGSRDEKLEKTSSPFISLVLKIQRRSSNPTITRSRR